MAQVAASERIWTYRGCEVGARVELEHYLQTFMKKPGIQAINVLATRKGPSQGDMIFKTACVRHGSRTVMFPRWQASRSSVKPPAPHGAVHLVSVIGSPAHGVTVDVDVAISYETDTQRDLDAENRLLSRVRALVAVLTTRDLAVWLYESQRNNCFMTLLQCVLMKTQVASAILWFVTPRSGGQKASVTALSAAGFRSLKRGVPALHTPIGEGVVGRAVQEEQIRVERLGPGGAQVMNPDLVANEGWCSCVVLPLMFDSECVGALSLYARKGSLEAGTAIAALEAETPVATLAAARASRNRRRELEAEQMMSGAMRLQAGLTMVGLVHDLARHAKTVHQWAETLREPLKVVSLKAGIPQTVDDMIQSADLVGRLTATMDKLTLGREDQYVRVRIEERLADLESTLSSLDKSIKVVIDGSATVRGPSSLVERLVFNLVVNSINWTPKDGREITVNFYRAKGSDVATLSVVDNGQGMTEEQIGVVREPFVSFRENGSGLGLFLVDKLCREVHATLSIASEPLQRTTVEVAFEQLES